MCYLYWLYQYHSLFYFNVYLSKTIDNSIIINYQNVEDNASNNNDINNITWIYKGQADINSIPNGYGVKYVKNGSKQEGYWKEGQLIGWSQSINFLGNILIGPFIDGKLTVLI